MELRGASRDFTGTGAIEEAGALRYRAWAQSWSSAALAARRAAGITHGGLGLGGVGTEDRSGLEAIPDFSEAPR